jgi:hypothetical protein
MFTVAACFTKRKRPRQTATGLLPDHKKQGCTGRDGEEEGSAETQTGRHSEVRGGRGRRSQSRNGVQEVRGSNPRGPTSSNPDGTRVLAFGPDPRPRVGADPVALVLPSETGCKGLGATFELVVYPQADHGFNLETGPRGEPPAPTVATMPWTRGGALPRCFAATTHCRSHHIFLRVVMAFRANAGK